jgi:CheY-like chemotaxis protein
MIVEDENLVAMMLADQMTGIGLSVVGPFASVAEAKTAVANLEFDAALLDVNLGGEPVYPVAELLLSRNIPFAFVSGYGQECIDARFAGIPVLEKPVECDALREVFAGAAGL